MTKSKHIFVFILLVFLFQKSQAQDNLVPNGDFEDVTVCNIAQKDNFIPRFWFTPHDRPIPLDDPCYYGGYWSAQNNTHGINGTKCGYMETYGIFTQLTNISHHRAYLATKLTQPLVADQQYYFEMSFRTLDTVETNWVTTDFTDGQALAFTNDFPIYDWNKPNIALPLVPVLSNGLVKDFNWHKLKGCFQAKGGEQFLLIGNFKENNLTIRTPSGLKSPTQFNSSSFLVDNVVLTPVRVNLKDSVVCQGETVAFDVRNPFLDSLQFRWHDNSTTPQYKTSKTGNIYVQVIYPTKNCIAEGFATVKVIGTDYQSPTKDTTLCQNETVTFTAGTGKQNESIVWQNGSKIPNFEAHTEGVYWAKIKNQCAAWTDSFHLHINHCGFDFFVPTAFSPNGDGVNDAFKPNFKMDYIKIEDYDFRVYNRWGSLVFMSKDVSTGWDGTYRGQISVSDVYIWSITVRVRLNGSVQVKQLSGDVSIVR